MLLAALPDYNFHMKVEVYSAAWCRDCLATKRFLEAHGVSYTEINVEEDPAAFDEVLRHVGKRAIPQMVIDGEWWQPYAPGRGLLVDELYSRLGISRS
jgi:mycoredoxin